VSGVAGLRPPFGLHFVQALPTVGSALGAPSTQTLGDARYCHRPPALPLRVSHARELSHSLRFALPKGSV